MPASWPVYCGVAAEKLIRLTAGITGKSINRSFNTWRSGEMFQLGPFKITALLTDHSAFDAYMLLIEAEGRRVLYSGDFRIHGRKSALVEQLMAHPPADIDVLLMEGTNLGSNKPAMREGDLEGDFAALFNATPGRVFVAWSAQNIDRTVTLYRAAKRTGRILVVDLYTAEVLRLLSEHGRIPTPDFENMKVVITSVMARMYKRKGMSEFVDSLAKSGKAISARALASDPSRWVIMLRGSLIGDYAKNGVVPDANDAWCWSMWRGYLATSGASVASWAAAGGATARHIHTSGHASPADLRSFASASGARRLVPIHSFTWDENMDGFPPIHRLRDGETMRV